jgi:hypothetical protein
MSASQLNIGLHSPSWGADSGNLAVVEVTPLKREPNFREKHKLTLAVNAPSKSLPLQHGEYIVRLFMPAGEIKTEVVEVLEGSTAELNFDIGKSPHEWLGQAASVGIVQTLPRTPDTKSFRDAISRSVQSSFRGDTKALNIDSASLFDQGDEQFTDIATKALTSFERSASEVSRISGRELVSKAEGWLSVNHINPKRSLPEHPQLSESLVQWWTGTKISEPLPMTVVQSDSRNARLAIPESLQPSGIGRGERRLFAKVRDPVGGKYCAVFPEGWQSTSHSRIFKYCTPSILLTVVIDTVMTEDGTRANPARWRCAPEIDDIQTMSLLGFLHSGQAEASQLMLGSAHDFLFEKTINPVAAALGAYTLLSHSDEANGQLSPRWRRWVSNLYERFPNVPDGAIAMAQMAMSFGERDRGDYVDVERIRGYALEAVRRGLPYLGTGVRRLTDVLIALTGDDLLAGRSGPAVEDTRVAFALVRELGRITVSGEFFTVLQLDEEPS